MALPIFYKKEVLLTFFVSLTTIIITLRLVWWHPAVPNLVHFYRSRRECGNLSSAELSCLMNAVALHPEVIVHCELPDQLSGVLEAIGVRPKGLTVKRWPSLVQPLDTPFHRHSLYNALQILKTYGGIYLENNVFLLKNLDDLRHHETTVSLMGGNVQTQLLAANRNSNFVNIWLSKYKDYKRGTIDDPFIWDKNVHLVKEAVIPIYKDVYFLSTGMNLNSVYGVQIR